jgi:protein-disulfide isomerase
VEFSDFQCPYCARANGVLKQVEQRYAGKVRVVFRHFPLPSHKEAAKAAEAAGCAGAQGRFWEMHDKLFANQRAQAASDLKRYAAEIGLDGGPFDRCLDSGSYAKVVEEDVAEGRRHGVTGTPTFFVNGRLLSGAAPFEVLALAIDEELERLAVKPAGAPTAAVLPDPRRN